MALLVHWPWRRSHDPALPDHPTAVFLLRCGYVALVVLLGIAARLAFSVQKPPVPAADDAPAGHYAKAERLLSLLSDSLGQGSDLVREYSFDENADRDLAFERRLTSLRGETALRIAQLQALYKSPDALGDLQRSLSDYWSIIDRFHTPSTAALAPHLTLRLRMAESDRRDLLASIQQRISSLQASFRARQLAKGDDARRERSELFLLLLFCVIFAILLGCASTVYSSKAHLERLRKYEDSVRSETQLFQLSARLLTVQENERKRLSRELHDGIGQVLTALKMEISYVERLGRESGGAMPDRLARARALADEAMRTVRDVSLLLRPVQLDELGLEPALRWQIEDFSRRTNIPCEFHCAKLDDLEDSYKTCVYRVVQESLNNCQKHASPSRVTISIEQNGDWLLLQVEDDGCGFLVDNSSPPLLHSGLGILGMRERAAIFGGVFRIESALGRGTLVTMSLNVKANRPPQETTVAREQIYANSNSLG